MSAPSLAPLLDPAAQEDEFVHTVYNDIAAHFSQTRYKPWPIVEDFLQTRAAYLVGLDVGCGNGKYLGVNPSLYIVGSDRLEGLVECAHANSRGRFSLAVADGLHLPHANGAFDFAILIAVIHHFATAERRVAAIRHILSKLRRGGELLVYCWALEQATSRRGYKEGDDQDVLVPWVLQKKKAPAEAAAAPETKYRYYHLYKKGELRENAVQAGGTVVREGYEKDNWWCVVKRA